MRLSPEQAARVQSLLDRLGETEDLLHRDPAKRQLKFALTGSGKGYIQGDEVRVRMCCDLYNERELLSYILTIALHGEPDVTQ